MKSNKKGFVEIIVLIIIAVVVLSFFGLNPQALWNNMILPILESLWNIFLSVVGFIIDIGIWIVDKFNLANGANN